MEPHERKPLRLKGYDYSSERAYFVTICTKNRTDYFGGIREGIMGLNEMGLVAHECWQDIPKHFENAVVDEFVVMPDHVHGIVFTAVGDRHACPLRQRQPRPNHQKIPVIIGSFKSSVTRIINEKNFKTVGDANLHPPFAWQRSYHDRIIRNEDELNRIHRYIRENPKQT